MRVATEAEYYHLSLVSADSALAEPAWAYLAGVGGTTADEALRTYVAHAPEDEARTRLLGLAVTDGRKSVRTTAIAALVGLGAAREVESLLARLDETLGVTWAVHIELLDAIPTPGLPTPRRDDLADVDNLQLIRSVVAAYPR